MVVAVSPFNRPARARYEKNGSLAKLKAIFGKKIRVILMLRVASALECDAERRGRYANMEHGRDQSRPEKTTAKFSRHPLVLPR